MKPLVEKIVAVWEKEPGLCRSRLGLGRFGEWEMGCAVGSLLWSTGELRLLDLQLTAPSLRGGGQDERTARSLLRKHFALTVDRIRILIAWNDHDADTDAEPAARRDYMIARIREVWGGA